MRGFGSLLEADTKADTKHDIGPTCSFCFPQWLPTYKRGLDTVEAQLVTYRKNEVLFSEEVVVLKREVGIKQYEINVLKSELEKVKQENDGIDFKIEKFVPLPHPLIYNRPNKLDLYYSGLDEFKELEFKGYGLKNSKKESNVVCENESDNSKKNSDKSLVEEQVSQVKSSSVEGCGSNTNKSVSEVEPKKVRKNIDAPIIEDWVSNDEEQDESKTKPEKKTVIPTAAKIEKPVKKSVSLRLQWCLSDANGKEAKPILQATKYVNPALDTLNECRVFMESIKARFGGNEASKEDAKESSQGQYFETISTAETAHIHKKDISWLSRARKTEQMVVMKRGLWLLMIKLKCLGGIRQHDDYDWTKEFVLKPFDAEHMHFGQDGLDDLTGATKLDDAQYEILGFGIGVSNSYGKLDISSGDETLTDSTYENFKREKAYKAVPPPTGTIIPPRANVSFTGIDELAIRNKSS
ncbi:hypothetical protein Tco_1133617 [Tanacetum coccineum]